MPYTIEPRHYLDPDVTRMVEEVQAEYVELYGGPDAAEVDPAEFAPPNGLFLVAFDDPGLDAPGLDEPGLDDPRLGAAVPVAMGGWRRLTDTAAEIKRMYVARPARRRGLGRLVLAELERTAAEAGIARLVLNTGPEQPAAIAMYVQAGYEPSAGFGHYACHPDALFYAKDLAVTARS